MRRLERATFWAEAPLRRAVGDGRLNPLPYAGRISAFLLVVVIASGVYITLFFQFGFVDSYASVRAMRDHPIQSVVRSVHRYASAALVVTTVVHAWRIFVAGRFRGPRRWRWSSGVAAVVVVWLAGVTGYWLVWDRRAQAITEATTELFGAGTFAVRRIYGSTAGSGWAVVFVLWLTHLALTAVIGWFLWRHLRRSRLAVVPPRYWMLAMGGAIVLVALAVPAGVLGAADPSRMVADMPLDPFVLFLLPPLLGGDGWWVLGVAALVVAATAMAPHLLAAPTPVIEVDQHRCTGCDLCAIDCPYEAISMVERESLGDAGVVAPLRRLAVVDAAACVGCGICLGSCSFGALTLPGHEIAMVEEVAGRDVVIACRRHLADSPRAFAGSAVKPVVVGVSCAGMVHAQTVSAVLRRGATDVRVVGCAVGDCAYGIGNALLEARLEGTRAPHVAARWKGQARTSWVAPTELGVATGPTPHVSTSADASTALPGAATSSGDARGRLAVAAAVVFVSVLAVVFGTRAPFRADDAVAGVRVIVDHVPGQQLEGWPEPTGAPGDPVIVVVSVDGVELVRERLGGSSGAAVGIVDAAVDVAPVDPLAVSDAPVRDVTIDLLEGGDAIRFYDRRVRLEAGRRLVVEAKDVPPPPGVEEGRVVFESRSLGGCGVCHSVQRGDDRVGPSLWGVADRAVTRVAGYSAQEYLYESIVRPDEHIVDGYRAGQMLPIYEERLSPAQISSLVTYLLTLTEGQAS